MLSVAKYSPDHVAQARARVSADIAAYKALRRSADGELDGFESVFFNNMVLVLDHYFLHRARNLEGKDGNALNEARVVCNSLTNNDGVLLADKTIRLKPENSVLGCAVGDRITIDAGGFERLAEAFLAEIEARYS